ncbi:MAG: hypothetical protein DRI90_22320, partial [Deltaproteobacteria bacterium]
MVGVAVAAGSLVSTGCHYNDDYYDDYYNDPYYDEYYTTVDADYVLETDLGYGAGVFVEYSIGGLWYLWTSCDTSLDGGHCAYDVHVIAHSPIDFVAGYDLEGWDNVDQYAADAFSFYADTAYYSDAVEFSTNPGALVEIELVLDGYVAPEFFVWY